MPNVFREQAEDRFTRSLAFLNKADTLLQDDLVNRSALADAVSAIKNMLQGYLLLRVSETSESGVTQRWQEIASSNSMPELLGACGEAGLDLRGLAVDIKNLNRERNRRMHDDPGQRIEAQQAHHALDLARAVQRRIKAAVTGTSATVAPEPAQVASHSAPARIAAVARAAVTGQLGRATPRTAPHTTAEPAPASALQTETQFVAAEALAASASLRAGVAGQPMDARAAAGESASLPPPDQEAGDAPGGRGDDTVAASGNAGSSADDDDGASDADDSSDSGDTQVFVALSAGRGRRRSRVRVALVRALLVAATLVVGVAVGAGLMFPVATGKAPDWLAFATQLLPATPMPTATSVATATATLAPSGPYAAGTLTVTPACVNGGAVVTLANTGVQPLRWSVGSPDGAGIAFTQPGAQTAAPSQAGTLKGGASVLVGVSGAASGGETVVVVASTGTVQLPAPTC